MVCVKSGSLCLLHYQAQIVNTANAWQLLKTVGWQMKKSEENERIHLKLMQSTLSCHGCKGRVSGICTHTNRSKSHHIKLPLDSFLSSSAQWERDTHRERRETRRESERETDRQRQTEMGDRHTERERDGRQRERWETERERWHGERERGMQTDRQTDRQTQTDRWTNRQMERELTILACLALTSRAPGMRDTAIAASFAFFFSALLSSGGENRIYIFHFPQSRVLFVD